MVSKVVYLGKWVRAKNMMGKRFKAEAPCSICKVFKCETVWKNIHTNEVRCTRCFDAEKKHWNDQFDQDSASVKRNN